MSNFSKNIWFDGKLVPFNEANINVMSHCIHYGSGVFEGIKCYDTPDGPAVFRLKEHMERLHTSSEAFKMKVPFTVDELCDGTLELIESNNVTNCYLRPVAFYGFDTLGINARFKCDKNYYSKVKKCFSLGTLNNTGRYLKLNNFYKFINFIFLIRILEIFNFKKRNY